MSDDPPDGQPPPPPRSDCLCMGLGPELTRILRQLAPSEQTWQHLRTAELEGLRALRTLLDERIKSLTREPERGTKLTVE